MILIFAGAFYVSKALGKHYSAQTGASSAMRVIDRLALGRDHYLLIVEAGEKTLLIGVGPQHIETLAELDGKAFADLPQVQENTDFFRALKNRMNK